MQKGPERYMIELWGGDRGEVKGIWSNRGQAR